MVSIAVIPARSGSKRIPNKNFISVKGVSMVNHAIKLAESTGIFDKVIVSVDSEMSPDHILDVQSIKHVRPAHLGSDEARTVDVIKDVIVSRKVGSRDNVCCIYPTSFLLSKDRIIEGLSLLNENSGRFVFAAQQSRTHPLRMFSIDCSNQKIQFLDENSLLMNTQNLKNYYSDAGQFYWASVNTWIDEKEILNSDSIPLVLKKWETIDIDTPEDLNFALEIQKWRDKGLSK